MSEIRDRLRTLIARSILDNSSVNTHPWEAEARANAVLDLPLMMQLLTAADRPHVLAMSDDGWSIEHPLTCSLNGAVLHECAVHTAVSATIDELHHDRGNGRYTLTLMSDGGLWLEEAS